MTTSARAGGLAPVSSLARVPVSGRAARAVSPSRRKTPDPDVRARWSGGHRRVPRHAHRRRLQRAPASERFRPDRVDTRAARRCRYRRRAMLRASRAPRAGLCLARPRVGLAGIGGVPTGRHDAERSARDAKSGGVNAETRSRAIPPNAMTKSADRIPPPIGGRTSAVRPRRRRLHGRLPTGPRSSFATDGRSSADDKVAKVLANPDVRSPRLVLDGSRLPATRHHTPKRRRTNHCVRPTSPQQEWRSKRARWLLSAICSDDGCSSHDGDSQVISAARP